MNHHRQQTIFFFSCKALKYAIERNRSTAYVCSHPTFDIDIYTHIGLISLLKSMLRAPPAPLCKLIVDMADMARVKHFQAGGSSSRGKYMLPDLLAYSSSQLCLIILVMFSCTTIDQVRS